MIRALVDAEDGVDVEDELGTLDEHGVDLEVSERDGVAGGLGGFGEELAHEVGGVDLHLLGELAGEEGDEEEVELGGVGEVVDAGVAEADGLALGVGEDGDVDVAGEGDSDAVAVDAGSELGAGVDADDDAVVVEGDVGLFGVDVAGGVGVAAEVVAAVGGVEELGAEGALEGLGGDSDFGGAGLRGDGSENKRTTEKK